MLRDSMCSTDRKPHYHLGNILTLEFNLEDRNFVLAYIAYSEKSFLKSPEHDGENISKLGSGYESQVHSCPAHDRCLP